MARGRYGKSLGALISLLLLLACIASPGASVAAASSLPVGGGGGGYSYTVDYGGRSIALRNVLNFTPAGGPVGTGSNFQTTDPNYTCENGGSMPVYTGQSGYPGDIVFHYYNPACTRQAGTFVAPSPQRSPSLALTASPNPLPTSQAGTLTATLSQPVSDGTVTFTGSGPNGATFPTNTCTPSGGSCSLPWQSGAAGTWTIDASWSGDSQYGPATASTTVTVTSATSGISLTVAASPNPLPTSQAGTLTATLSQPVSDGTVTFTGSGPNGATFPTNACTPSGGSCSLPWQSGAAGTWTISASWSGDSRYGAATGSTTVTVTQSGSQSVTLTVTASPDPATPGQNLQFQATVSQPVGDGTVAFTGGWQNSINESCTPGQGSCSGSAVTGSWTPGTYTIDASWSGDSQYAPASGSATVTINASQPSYTYTCGWDYTTVQLARVTNRSVEKDPLAFKLGQCANFQTDDPNLAALNGASFDTWLDPLRFGLGTYVVHNDNDGPPYGTWTFTPPAALKVDVGPSVVASGQFFIATATLPASASDGTVTFVGPSGGNVTCTPSGGSCSVLLRAAGSGSATVVARWSGDSRNGPAGGATSIRVVNPPTSPSSSGTLAIAVSPSNGDLLAGTNNGIYRSTDGGQTWRQVQDSSWQLTANVDALTFGPDGTAYVVFADPEAGCNGLFGSSLWATPDDGGSWSCYPVTVGGADALAVDSSGALFMDAGGSTGFPTLNTYKCCDTDGFAYINNSYTAGLYYTTDGGNTWTSSWQAAGSIEGLAGLSFESGASNGAFCGDGSLWTTSSNGGSAGAWQQNAEALCSAFSSQAITLTIGSRTAHAGGKASALPVAPRIRGGRTFVPLRFVSEALGAQVSWDGATRQATIVLGAHAIVMTEGETTYTIDGHPHESDAAPFILPPGYTMVPIRFVSEALHFQVAWDATTQTVTITPAAAAGSTATGSVTGGSSRAGGAGGS